MVARFQQKWGLPDPVKKRHHGTGNSPLKSKYQKVDSPPKAVPKANTAAAEATPAPEDANMKDGETEEKPKDAEELQGEDVAQDGEKVEAPAEVEEPAS